MPVIHTGVYLHMPIAVTQPAVASLSHLANDRPLCYRFFTFWPWG